MKIATQKGVCEKGNPEEKSLGFYRPRNISMAVRLKSDHSFRKAPFTKKSKKQQQSYVIRNVYKLYKERLITSKCEYWL